MSISLHQESVVLNGIPIHCIERPAKGETAIVFIHGRCMSAHIWEKQFASPLLNPYRLLAFDLPGHGESGRATDQSGYSLASYKRTLLALIEHYQLTDYLLVGLSLGGHIVLQALPDLNGCRGLFAMTMPIAKPMEPQLMYRPNDLAERAFQPSPSATDIHDYIRQLLQFEPDEVPDVLINDFKQTDPSIHTGILQSILDGHYENEQELIRSTPIPVALVAGAEDQLHELSYLGTPNPAIWRQAPQFVGAAGHLLPWENSVAVNELLVRFMGDFG